MSINKQAHNIVKFLKQTLHRSGTTGFTLGMSGGIDSSVCAALAKKAVDQLNRDSHPGDRTYRLNLIILPMGNQPSDAEVATEVCKSLGMDAETVKLGDSLLAFINAHGVMQDDDAIAKTVGNVKARLRMTALYFNANLHNTMVIGTDNLAETYTGYFTKHGDGAADVFPLSDFTKREVYELGRFLGLPESVLSRAPSAGLWDGQTDESEMGVPYDYIDNHLEGLQDLNRATYGMDRDMEYRATLARLNSRTEHKRAVPHIYRKNETYNNDWP